MGHKVHVCSMTRLLLFSLFLLVFLRPHPEAFGSLLAVYLFDLAVVCSLVLAMLIAGERRGLPSSAAPWCGMGFMALIFLYVILLLHAEPVLVFEASKIAYYLFFVVAVLYVFISPASNVRWQLNGTLDAMVFLLAAIAVIQLFEVAIVNDLVGSIWGTKKLRGLSSSSPRVFSSFYNANWLGIVAAMLLVTYARRIMLFHRAKAMNWVLAFLCLFLLLVSGARSGLLAMLVGLTLLFGGRLLSRRLRLISFRHIFLSFVVGAFCVALSWSALSDNKRITEVIAFVSTGDLSSIPSAAIRIDQWQQSVYAISNSPLFGLGGVGEALSPHNSFLFMALLFGLVGAVMVMLVFASLIAALSKGFGKGGFAAPLISILLVGSFTAEFFFTTQVMLAFFLILACWYESGFIHRRIDGTSFEVLAFRRYSHQSGTD